MARQVSSSSESRGSHPWAFRDRRLERLPPELSCGVAPHRVRIVQVERQREERRGRAVLADPAVQQRTEAPVEAVERDDRGVSADALDRIAIERRAALGGIGQDVQESPVVERQAEGLLFGGDGVGRGLQVRGPTVPKDGVQPQGTQRAAVAEVIHPERRPVRQLQREHREIDAKLGDLLPILRAR